MRTNEKYDKGDALAHRLFFFLRAEQMQIEAVIPLRPFVFELHCRYATYILKGYGFYKMEQQTAFLRALQETHFSYTPYLCPFPSGSYAVPFAGSYWLLYRYIEHKEFSFQKESDRADALSVLSLYHEHAHNLPLSLLHYVPALPWLEKWALRAEKFRRHAAFIEEHIGKEHTAAFLYWADRSLQALRQSPLKAMRHSFLHGDIIEHNFVRGSRLYLIDFDCVSIGPVIYDYLKYCLCILPALRWSYDALYRYAGLHRFLRDRHFLKGLLFPGDVLREWDYFLSLSDNEQDEFREELVTFTKHESSRRFAFVEMMHNMVT